MKIAILSASPQRDSVIDSQLKDELESRGHEVTVAPMLRAGRDTVLKLQPDVVVVPPIRNPHSRDFVEVCRDWNIGVISRHTEASCDWSDFKAMKTQREQGEILGLYKYAVNAELVWGADEAQILLRRRLGFPIVPVGCVVADIYFKKDIKSRFLSREKYCKKFKLNPKKKTICVASSWGFADSAPDLQIDEMRAINTNEDKGKKRYIALLKQLKKLNYNILFRPHPGIILDDYKKLEIPTDTESPATEVLLNCAILIHSGSTLAMEMHWLSKPAFQYGDVNRDYANNWFQIPNSPLSKISPSFKSIPKLIEAIKAAKPKSNALPETLKILAEGRFGLMDGQAIKRIADVVCGTKGKYTPCWPRAHQDYDLPHMFKAEEKAVNKTFCGICKREFRILKPEWAERFCTAFAVANKKEVLERLTAMHMNCPNCAARLLR